MTEPLAQVLQNVEQSLHEQPPTEVAKFAPQKYRGVNAASLLSIHQDIRKTIDDLNNHRRRLDEYSQQLKSAADELTRSAG